MNIISRLKTLWRLSGVDLDTKEGKKLWQNLKNLISDQKAKIVTTEDIFDQIRDSI